MIYKLQNGQKLTDTQRNWNIAKAYLKSKPTLSNIYNALHYLLNGPSKYQTGQPDIIPGFQVKGLMSTGNLVKQVSKKGTVSTNNVRAIANKGSTLEREIVNDVLNKEYQGKKLVDFGDLQRTVQSRLVPYTTKSQTKFADYGVDRIGYTSKLSPENMTFNPVTGKFESSKVSLDTYTFESPKIPMGNATHYDTTTLGHSRTFTTPEEPSILHVLETQSDWAQHPTGVKSYNKGTQHSRHYITQLRKQIAQMKERSYPQEQVEQNEQRILKQKQYQEVPSWHIKYLQDNYLPRQLQENMLYASRQGKTSMRYPTRETAANIEGYIPYLKFSGHPEKENLAAKLIYQIQDTEAQIANGTNIFNYQRLSKRLDDLKKQFNLLKQEASETVYSPEEETILNKYDMFPKMFNKLFKEQSVKTIVDQKGNGWFEVNIPKNMQDMQLQYKKGGKI